MGTINNIYVLNFIVNRKEEREIGFSFVDLKAAFNSVNGRVLWRYSKDKVDRGDKRAIRRNQNKGKVRKGKREGILYRKGDKVGMPFVPNTFQPNPGSWQTWMRGKENKCRVLGPEPIL